MILTLTGTDGIPVSPDSLRNIFLAGTNVTITGSPSLHTLTLTALNGVSAWYSIVGNITLTPNCGYVCSGGTNLILTLPATSAVGEESEVTLDGSTSFIIQQQPLQRIRYGDRETSVGIAGQLISLNQGDSVRLVCSVANTRWNALSTQGSLTVA